MPRHPALRFAPGSFTPSSLRGSAYKGHPWPLSLSPHPCGSPLYATIPLTLLKGRLELPESHVSSPAPTLCVGANPVRSSSQSCRPVQNNEWTEGMGTINARSARKSHQATRSPNPVRRPSGGVAQGDARQDAERGTKGQGRPFVTAPGAAPERGKFRVAKPGCRARFLFGYFLFACAKRK